MSIDEFHFIHLFHLCFFLLFTVVLESVTWLPQCCCTISRNIKCPDCPVTTWRPLGKPQMNPGALRTSGASRGSWQSAWAVKLTCRFLRSQSDPASIHGCPANRQLVVIRRNLGFYISFTSQTRCKCLWKLVRLVQLHLRVTASLYITIYYLSFVFGGW